MQGFGMPNRADDRVVSPDPVETCKQIDPAMPLRLAGVRVRIVNVDGMAASGERVDDVHDPRVAQVGHTLLEGQAEDEDTPGPSTYERRVGHECDSTCRSRW